LSDNQPPGTVARNREIAGEGRIFEMTHSRRSDACLGESVVEPGAHAAAEVGAERLMDGREHLHENEGSTQKCERSAQPLAALHRVDQQPGGDDERRRKHPAQDQHGPPAGREGRVGFG